MVPNKRAPEEPPSIGTGQDRSVSHNNGFERLSDQLLMSEIRPRSPAPLHNREQALSDLSTQAGSRTPPSVVSEGGVGVLGQLRMMVSSR
jgi:hypothetical protein